MSGAAARRVAVDLRYTGRIEATNTIDAPFAAGGIVNVRASSGTRTDGAFTQFWYGNPNAARESGIDRPFDDRRTISFALSALDTSFDLELCGTNRIGTYAPPGSTGLFEGVVASENTFAAERVSAVPLFDEADALFGRRSEVNGAHDRCANVEI